MVRLTQSLEHWLWENHRDIIALIMLGHTELFTVEMQKAYIEWCKTDEGKQYLKGGSKYEEKDDGTPLVNLIWSDIWKDQKTGKEVKGDLWNELK